MSVGAQTLMARLGCVACAALLALALLPTACGFAPRSIPSDHTVTPSSACNSRFGPVSTLNLNLCQSSRPPASASARAAAARLQLRDITARLYTAPKRTAWTTPSATAAAAAKVAAYTTRSTPSMALPSLDKKSSRSGGSTVLDRPPAPVVVEKSANQSKPEDKFKVMLFNDSGNTREYVSRALVQEIGMPESEAFSVMTMAHKNGMAVVGIWHLEAAEMYCDSLKTRGLVSEVFPIDSSE